MKQHGAKFPVITCTRSYSMVEIARLNDTFLESFQLEASPVEGQSLLPGKAATTKILR